MNRVHVQLVMELHSRSLVSVCLEGAISMISINECKVHSNDKRLLIASITSPDI